MKTILLCLLALGSFATFGGDPTNAPPINRLAEKTNSIARQEAALKAIGERNSALFAAHQKASMELADAEARSKKHKPATKQVFVVQNPGMAGSAYHGSMKSAPLEAPSAEYKAARRDFNAALERKRTLEKSMKVGKAEYANAAKELGQTKLAAKYLAEQAAKGESANP